MLEHLGTAADPSVQVGYIYTCVRQKSHRVITITLSTSRR